MYRDATTDHTGMAQTPAAPPAQDAKLSIIVEGSGQIPNVDPQCALDPAGSFEAHYLGSLNLTDDDVYASSLFEAATEIRTPSGCEIPELAVAAITGARVRAELTVTTQNCQTYCAAAARANAEEQCGATAASAECRATAEASGEAACTTTCTTDARVIVAEASLAASLFGSLDANALRAAALGDLEVDLVFDRMEDGDGTVLDF
jgi:hypothetical protein